MTKVPWGRETMAGLAGAIGSVPDGMATAVLAGANPMAGLYASFAGPVAGGFLQSTTVMVVATTSAAAVTTAEVMNAGPTDPIRTLATLTVLAGLFMLLATALGFARLMRFVSASVMAGFMFGVGLILILGQLADATGVKTSGDNTLEKALNTLRQWQSFDRASMLTAATAIGISILLGRGKLVALAPLIAIVVPTLVLKVTGADVANVASTSGPIEVGLPPLVLPDVGLISPTLIAVGDGPDRSWSSSRPPVSVPPTPTPTAPQSTSSGTSSPRAGPTWPRAWSAASPWAAASGRPRST